MNNGYHEDPKNSEYYRGKPVRRAQSLLSYSAEVESAKKWRRSVWICIALGVMALAVIAMSGCDAPERTETTAPTASASITEERTILDENGKPIERHVTTKSGTATGSGAAAQGDEVSQEMKSEPASVHVNGITSTGGGGESDSEVAGAQSLWSNPLLWVGIAFCAASAAALYFSMKRAAFIGFIVGGGLICAAMLPEWAWVLIAFSVLIGGAVYVYAEWRAKRSTEALRATVAGVESLPPDASIAVKSEIGKQADELDKREIKRIKRMDSL